MNPEREIDVGPLANGVAALVLRGELEKIDNLEAGAHEQARLNQRREMERSRRIAAEEAAKRATEEAARRAAAEEAARRAAEEGAARQARLRERQAAEEAARQARLREQQEANRAGESNDVRRGLPWMLPSFTPAPPAQAQPGD